MFKMYLLRIIKIALIAGIIIGVLAIFNFDIGAVVSHIIEWLYWVVDSIAQLISGNAALRQLLTTRPQ